MAQAIGCDLCGQETAEMMQSALDTGTTIAVGHNCMITFFASALAAMVGQLDDDGRAANEMSLAMVTDAIGLLPSDEMPPQHAAERAAPIGPDDVPLTEIYEDGNTEHGIKEAMELNDKLAET